jgi:SAM-dependent methyltransferase
MALDLRAEAARYYDLNPNTLADVPFYIDRLPKPDARVLELGCGTGRVSLPLAAECAFVRGLDLSEAMLDLCREKIANARLGPDRIVVEHGKVRGQILPFDIPSPAAVLHLILLLRRLHTSVTPSRNTPFALGGPNTAFRGTRIAVALAASREADGLPREWAAFHGS